MIEREELIQELEKLNRPVTHDDVRKAKRRLDARRYRRKNRKKYNEYHRNYRRRNKETLKERQERQNTKIATVFNRRRQGGEE